MDGGGNIKRYHAHLGCFPFYLKLWKFSVGTSNGTDHFDLVRPVQSGPALKVVHFDRSGHFGRSERNNRSKCLFPFDNIVVPSTPLLYPTYENARWLGSGLCKRNRVFSHDVTTAILVFQNNKTAAMVVSQNRPPGVELFSYADAFFCSNKFAQMMAT